MNPPSVRSAESTELDRVVQTITLGFVGDPVARWMWPEPKAFLEAMPKLTVAFGGRGLDHRSIYLTEGCKAAAMWLPPKIEPDEGALESVIAEHIAPERMEEIATFFGKMDEFHPEQPCWYLPLIAADPAFTGQGLGGALMKHALRRCDDDGVVAYLESSNPRNISLYERHGFEIMGTIQVGSSPVMTPMLRQAQ